VSAESKHKPTPEELWERVGYLEEATTAAYTAAKAVAAAYFAAARAASIDPKEVFFYPRDQSSIERGRARWRAKHNPESKP
jgi:hypothetical protein